MTIAKISVHCILNVFLNDFLFGIKQASVHDFAENNTLSSFCKDFCRANKNSYIRE